MIIAAFAGTGKSWFCKKYEQAIDFVCIPFKYYNLSDFKEGEEVKASLDLELRFNWQKSYYEALVDTYKKYPNQIIVIPTIHTILNWLERDKIPYTLVYPEMHLCDEYKQRYINRGNTEDFLDVFIGEWEMWITFMSAHKSVDEIILRSGEYLTDVIEVKDTPVEGIILDKSNYLNDAYVKYLSTDPVKDIEEWLKMHDES